MTTFSKIIDKFRNEALSERDKGFRFERLMQAYLKTTSLHEGRFEEVGLWAEFPYHDQFGGKDVGIDLVAKTFSGDYWAAQCKCYADDKYITKADVDTFLSTSGKTFEVEGIEQIYVFNLRGNQRTSGELSCKEGGKIFGSGSRTSIAITILVKKGE